MSSDLTQTRSRGRRYLSAFAGLAMGAAAVLVPAGHASAAPNDLPPLPENAKEIAVPFDKLPAGAVRATRIGFEPGAHGSTFQSTAKAPSGTPRVIGGALANSADFPGVVGIKSYFLGEDEDGNEGWWVSTCTGTVLSSTKVLTAGHCVVDLPWGTTQVIAGRNNINVNSGGFVARVKTTWTHQGFNLLDTYYGTRPIDDVSVLTLKDALPSAYKPVTLTAQNDQSPYAAGTSATIVGYGVTTPTSNESGVLYKATVPMKSNTDCVNAYGSGKVDGNRMVCAGNPAQGIDTCHGDSGGPIFVNNVQAGITDWGRDPCASTYGVYEKLSYYSNIVKQEQARAGQINLDWTGDGNSDLFVRDPSGQLGLATGAGFLNNGVGGFTYLGLAGTGWSGYNKLLRIHNWNGDGNQSIFGRDSAGKLWQWKSDGKGNFSGSRQMIGNGGWNTYADLIPMYNFNGDGLSNLIGRKSNGELYLYSSDGKGGWKVARGTKIGVGWRMYNTVFSAGSWLANGKPSLIGRKPTGELLVHNADGKGGWTTSRGIQIGTGWGSFKRLLSVGDWNGDNLTDVIAITSGGTAKMYPSNGTGGWTNAKGVQIGAGTGINWNDFNLVF